MFLPSFFSLALPWLFYALSLYVLLSSLQYFMMTFKTNVILASVKITTTTIIYSQVNSMSDAVHFCVNKISRRCHCIGVTVSCIFVVVIVAGFGKITHKCTRGLYLFAINPYHIFSIYIHLTIYLNVKFNVNFDFHSY